MGFLDPNSWAQALSDDPTGSKYAADLQAAAAMSGQQLTREQWEYQKGLMDPYIQGGELNQDRMIAETSPGGYLDQWTMDKFKNSVPYQTMMDPDVLSKMNEGIMAQSSASGMFGSPAVANAIAKNLQTNALGAQGSAYGQWTDAYNRLVGRAQPGAASQVGAAGAAYAQNMNQLGMQGAQGYGTASVLNSQAKNNAMGNMTAGVGNGISQLVQDYIGNKGYFAEQPYQGDSYQSFQQSYGTSPGYQDMSYPTDAGGQYQFDP